MHKLTCQEEVDAIIEYKAMKKVFLVYLLNVFNFFSSKIGNLHANGKSEAGHVECPFNWGSDCYPNIQCPLQGISNFNFHFFFFEVSNVLNILCCRR